jgi:hypothetical protein
MAIKITYAKLALIGNAVVKLRAVDKAATIVERARLARFTGPLWIELGAYEKLRNELVAKYGTATVGGQPGSFRIEGADNVKAFAEETAALNAIEAELSISPLPVSLYSLANLTVEDLSNLGDLIVWPADEDAPLPAAPALASVPADK